MSEHDQSGIDTTTGFVRPDGSRLEIHLGTLRQLIRNPDGSIGEPKPLSLAQVTMLTSDGGSAEIPVDSIRHLRIEEDDKVVCETYYDRFEGRLAPGVSDLCVSGITPDAVAVVLPISRYCEYWKFENHNALCDWIAEGDDIEG